MMDYISNQIVLSDGKTFYRHKDAYKICYNLKEQKFHIDDVSKVFKAFRLAHGNNAKVGKSRNDIDKGIKPIITS